ncbi:MAG: DUF1002 domain-containing protein [Firmicutes bacterium]|nr:DUF1002 domain-containing protein [Bacillota bacterium]
MKKALWFLIWLLFTGATIAQAQQRQIISYGKDLKPAERQSVAKDFPLPANIELHEIKTLTVTNEEEWRLLKGLSPEAEIGTKAVSAVYLEKQAPGLGLEIETKNLSLVTPHMIANALVTAVVKDVKVVVAAPALIPGTAVLAGIFKSFEELTGSALNEDAKKIAGEELVKTAKLGEEIGKERAATLLERAKERVVQEEATDRAAVVKLVERAAREQDLSVTETQKQDVAELLLKIKGLNPDPDVLRKQLKHFREAPEEEIPPEEPKSFFERLLSFIRSLVDQLFSFVGRIFSIGG